MPEASTREQARSLCKQAEQAESELQKVDLAREALKLWEGCPDAHLIFANITDTPRSARRHFERALSLAREAIGEEELEEWAGELAHHEHGFSYLRALDGLALLGIHSEEGAPEAEDAAYYLREILRLDGYDHLGAAHTLLAHLIALADEVADEEAIELVEAYPCQCTQYLYSEALLAYRLDLEEAGDLAQDAILTDPYAAMYLLGMLELPDSPPAPERLEDDARARAAMYAALAADSWQATPGALQWLRWGVASCYDELRESIIEAAILEQMFEANANLQSSEDTARVLIADSQPVRQMGMKLALEGSGAGGPGALEHMEARIGEKQDYRPLLEVVAVASDLYSAYTAASENVPDVAIVDVLMRYDEDEPDSQQFAGVTIPGGMFAAYNLKHGLPEAGIEPTKVLLMGEYEDEEEPANEMMYTGADGYVDARLPVEELVFAVRRCCAGEEVRQGV